MIIIIIKLFAFIIIILLIIIIIIINNEARLIHWEHVPDRVGEFDEGKLLWDFPIQTEHVIEHRGPDLVFLDKQQGLCHIIDIAVAGDACREEKGKEKLEKCQDLRREVFRLWGVNVPVTQVVVGCGDEELSRETSANSCVCKKGISTESGIVRYRKNFAKSSWGLRLRVVASPQLNVDQWQEPIRWSLHLY